MNYEELEERVEELENQMETLGERVSQKMGVLELIAFIITAAAFYFLTKFVINLF